MRYFASLFLVACPLFVAQAQLTAPSAVPQSPAVVASVPVQGVSVRGAVSVTDGRATVGNNAEIVGGSKTAEIALARGGVVELCASTTLHISRDAVAHTQPGEAGLLFSIDRGAFETSYTPGAYSDVILTPDLRLLVSGPGQARLRLRVSRDGDTCVDNAGENAPYVVASSLVDGGTYRVKPGQRVLFVGGSLSQVVDNEHEPCGCPPEAPPAQVAGQGNSGGPSSTAADTAFPTAVSEGLQAPPTLAGQPPIVAPGQAHAQVAATLSSATPPEPPPAAAAAPTQPAPLAATSPHSQAGPHRGFLGSLGHFFARVFGASS